MQQNIKNLNKNSNIFGYIYIYVGLRFLDCDYAQKRMGSRPNGPITMNLQRVGQKAKF